MANEEHLNILQQGVEAWNRWREAYPSVVPNLSGMNLHGIDLHGAILYWADFSQAVLTGAKLTEVDLDGATLSNADLTGAKLTRASLRHAQLNGAKLIQAEMPEAMLRDANLIHVDLTDAMLLYADLVDVDLTAADLRRADLRWARLTRATLDKANLNDADMRGTNLLEAKLRGAHLTRANLCRAYLTGAHLQQTNLTGANLREANLIGAHFDRATITDALLWETQRAGWSIQGILCEAVYWGKDKKERTVYAPGEFERLYADKTKVVLHYAGGIISPIEVTTLPSMIEIMQKWSGCVLRLDALQDAPGGATVTLVIEEPGKRNADQTATLQAELQSVGQRAIEMQRDLIQEREGRLRAEGALNFVSNFFSPLMERVMAQSPGIQISISGGTIHGNIVGEVSGENAQVHYTHNDLAALEALVSEMSAHRAELPLTSAERTQFEEKLHAIQEQLAAQAPALLR